MALSFTLLYSTSPIFSDMSQESGTTSTLLNLESQLADAMTVIQTLMANIGNLTQQVVHLMQNMALIQANQNLPPLIPIPQPSPCTFPLPPSLQYQPLPPPSRFALAQDHAAPMPSSSCIREPKIATPSPFLEKRMTLNLSSIDAAYTWMGENWNSLMRMPRSTGSFHTCRLVLPRHGAQLHCHINVQETAIVLNEWWIIKENWPKVQWDGQEDYTVAQN